MWKSRNTSIVRFRGHFHPPNPSHREVEGFFSFQVHEPKALSPSIVTLQGYVHPPNPSCREVEGIFAFHRRPARGAGPSVAWVCIAFPPSPLACRECFGRYVCLPKHYHNKIPVAAHPAGICAFHHPWLIALSYLSLDVEPEIGGPKGTPGAISNAP